MRIQFRVRIREILKARRITQKQLAAMTGIREAAISDLVNDTRQAYNKEHLAKCMVALGLTDISEVIQTIVVKEKGGSC